MASNVIYDSGEDRKPDWKEAPAAYNEEGSIIYVQRIFEFGYSWGVCYVVPLALAIS